MNKLINRLREIFKIQPTASQLHCDMPIGESNRNKKIKKIEDDYASIIDAMQKIVDKRPKKEEKEASILMNDTDTKNQVSSEPFRGESF